MKWRRPLVKFKLYPDGSGDYDQSRITCSKPHKVASNGTVGRWLKTPMAKEGTDIENVRGRRISAPALHLQVFVRTFP